MASFGQPFRWETRLQELADGKGLADPDVRATLESRDTSLENYLDVLRSKIGAKFPVVTADIADDAVTTAKIAAGAVTETELLGAVKNGLREVFPDTTTRDAWSALYSPTFGQLCYVYSTDTEYVFTTDSTWRIWNFPMISAAYSTYAPTWTNLTAGNGTNASKYRVCNGGLEVLVNFQLGSTSSLGASNPEFSLPYPYFASASGGYPGYDSGYYIEACTGLTMYDATGGSYGGRLYANGLNRAGILVMNTAGTYATANNVSSTVPYTWAANDRIVVDLKLPIFQVA